MNALESLAWPRRTPRLVLRPATTHDLAAIYAYRRLPSVAQWMTSNWPGGYEQFYEFMSRPDKLAVTIVALSDDVVVGDLMVLVGDAWAQSEVVEAASASEAEIGWCFDPAWQGRGLATEAAGECLAVAFDGVGVRRVKAGLFADNTASRRLCERIGMRLEAHHRADSLHRDLGWVDGLIYGLTKAEWSDST